MIRLEDGKTLSWGKVIEITKSSSEEEKFLHSLSIYELEIVAVDMAM